MRCHLSLRWLCLSLVGLLPVGCGGPDTFSPPSEEPLGTLDAALCSGVSVVSLSIAGASSYGGELGASGSWQVSAYANAIRLEYYVDGALRTVEERPQASGTWYFSGAGLACGAHSFEVKSYPMIIDSAGSRTTCYENGARIASQSVTQTCPSSSMSCSRRSSMFVTCTITASGGSNSFTPYMREVGRPADHPESYYDSGWFQSSWTQSWLCPIPRSYPVDEISIHFKVRDSSGMESDASVEQLSCAAAPLEP